MNTIYRTLAFTCLGLAATAGFAVAGHAEGGALAMLGKLQPGQWELRFREGGATTRICLRTGRELIQIRHRSAGCSRYVVEDGATEVTIQYTCPGKGYGRTSIRQETATLAQVSSQGIADGQPFQITAEARRIGACR